MKNKFSVAKPSFSKELNGSKKPVMSKRYNITVAASMGV